MWRVRVHCADTSRETSVYLFTATEKDKCVVAEEAPSLSRTKPTTTALMVPTLTSDAQAASLLLSLLTAAIKITVAAGGSTLKRQTATHPDRLKEIFASISKTQLLAMKLNSSCYKNNKSRTRNKPRN